VVSRSFVELLLGADLLGGGTPPKNKSSIKIKGEDEKKRERKLKNKRRNEWI